jgi:hypothetical protein
MVVGGIVKKWSNGLIFKRVVKMVEIEVGAQFKICMVRRDIMVITAISE